MERTFPNAVLSRCEIVDGFPARQSAHSARLGIDEQEAPVIDPRVAGLEGS